MGKSLRLRRLVKAKAEQDGLTEDEAIRARIWESLSLADECLRLADCEIDDEVVVLRMADVDTHLVDARGLVAMHREFLSRKRNRL